MKGIGETRNVSEFIVVGQCAHRDNPDRATVRVVDRKTKTRGILIVEVRETGELHASGRYYDT